MGYKEDRIKKMRVANALIIGKNESIKLDEFRNAIMKCGEAIKEETDGITDNGILVSISVLENNESEKVYSLNLQYEDYETVIEFEFRKKGEEL